MTNECYRLQPLFQIRQLFIVAIFCICVFASSRPWIKSLSIYSSHTFHHIFQIWFIERFLNIGIILISPSVEINLEKGRLMCIL